MPEKRQYDDEAGPAPKRYKGAHRQHPDFKKNTPRPESNNWAKKRARTIERRLRNPDGLPGPVQVELQRELAALKDQINGKQEKKQRAHMISKYHMLRFFERKKAERLQKQLTRRLRETTDADERAEIEADLAIAEVDGLYARYHPYMEAYISLYPQTSSSKNSSQDEAAAKAEEKKQALAEATAKYGNSSAAKALRAPRPPLWALIKETAKDGVKALERVRERTDKGEKGEKGEDVVTVDAVKVKTEDKDEDKKKDKKGKEDKKDKKDKKKETDPDVKMEDEDEDDDGGFFE